MSGTTCKRCGRSIEWSDGAECWVAPNQALPPACGTTETGVRGNVRGHSPAEAERFLREHVQVIAVTVPPRETGGGS